jgi:glycine dehydrogenase subunit 2
MYWKKLFGGRLVSNFKQARWNEPTVFELGRRGRRGYILPEVEDSIKEKVGAADALVPPAMRIKSLPKLPEMSESEVVRHFTKLSQMNYSVDLGFYPLGSCTMKYNPKINDELARLSTKSQEPSKFPSNHLQEHTVNF